MGGGYYDEAITIQADRHSNDEYVCDRAMC